MNYQEFYKKSLQNPEDFWKEQSQELAWHKQPSNILSKDMQGYFQWFADGELNLSYLCIDKHIEDGFGNQNAIIYDSPVTNKKQSITYNQLHQEVSKLAGGLKAIGLEKGKFILLKVLK